MLSVLVLFKEKSKISGITTGEAIRSFDAKSLSIVGEDAIRLRNGLPITPGHKWEVHQIIVLGDASSTCTQDSGMG